MGLNALIKPGENSASRAQSCSSALQGPGTASDWLLWQLADSAFPTGGFAHSGGLEAAWQQGELDSAARLEAFFEASLVQYGRGALPLMTAVWNAPERWFELDEWCEAFTTNHVANRASRLQGQAFLASVERVFAPAALETAGQDGQRPPCGHWAPAFGAVAAALKVERRTAARLFLFLHLRALVSAAVRLGVTGPLHGQSMQHRLGARAEGVLERCLNLGLEDLAQTAPLIELWQGTQDRLYSRLFQS